MRCHIGNGEYPRQKRHRILKVSIMSFWGKTIWGNYDEQAKLKWKVSIDNVRKGMVVALEMRAGVCKGGRVGRRIGHKTCSF